MIGKIKYIANLQVKEEDELALNYFNDDMSEGTFEEFLEWIDKLLMVQLDIETDVTPWWHNKKLISIQFGSCLTGPERTQWFLQWSKLTPEQKTKVREILERPWMLWIAHNAKFECIVLKNYGILIKRVYDTMLAEKVLRGGMENDDYALADISWKYLRVLMDKTEQTNFGDDIITASKVKYGITDVAHLDTIKRLQYQELCEKDLLNVAGLEMEALLAFSDTTHEGMILDKERWRANIQLAEPIIQTKFQEIDKWLLKEPFYSYAVSKKMISDTDMIGINFNSVSQRNELIKLIFPEILGATKNIAKAYIRNNAMSMTPEELHILQSSMEGDYEPMQTYLIKNHRDYLIDKAYLVPPGQSTINWNSNPQVLPLAKLVEPRLKGLSEEDINKTKHPMLRDLQRYREALKLVSTYGEKFIREKVSDDGKVRTNFNQIISTGRVSSSNPNMQNIPVSDTVSIPEDKKGLRYRNAFTCHPDFVFVDSDYSSQELAIIAYLSKDPVWMDAIDKGYDLHSVCADLVFKKKWQDAADKDCAYYKMSVGADGIMRQQKHKCSCSKHKSLRDKIKPINFGLAYGMTEYKLAGTLGISVPEAAGLINEYFKAFPKIGAILEWLGEFGVRNGYIMTLAPFFRKRYFPYWEENRMYIQPHLLGAQRNKTLGEVERASKNMPIQGASADMVKVAMVLIRDYIYEHDMQDLIKIVAQVHDQITTICHKDHAEWWKDKLDELMCTAAKVIIPTGILKAETTISLFWTK